MSTIYQKLQKVQEELKAPKNQVNKFGGYKYRSCEDIMEAVKPLLAKQGLTLIVSDQIELVGDRYYVKALAQLMDDEGNVLTATAYARESEDKKGMDASQLTGACSSYARKYCLNGMFLIDDTKDADTMNNNVQTASQFGMLKNSITTSKTADDLSKTAKKISEAYNNGELSGDEQKTLKELYNKKNAELKNG